LWPRGLAPEDPEARLDRAEILTGLGILYEAGGDSPRAAGSYREALRVFPERAYLAERAAALEAGRAPEIGARQILEHVLARPPPHVCSDEAEEHTRDAQHEHGDGPSEPDRRTR
jgi:hypothetical protein